MFVIESKDGLRTVELVPVQQVQDLVFGISPIVALQADHQDPALHLECSVEVGEVYGSNGCQVQSFLWEEFKEEGVSRNVPSGQAGQFYQAKLTFFPLTKHGACSMRVELFHTPPEDDLPIEKIGETWFKSWITRDWWRSREFPSA